MEKLKILFITAWYPSQKKPIEGIFVMEHAKAASLYNDVVVLFNEGYDVSVKGIFEYKDSFEEGIRTIRIKYRRFPIPKMPYLNYLLTTFFATRKIIKNNFKPDLIHAHIYSAGVPAALIGKFFKIPVVITEQFSGFPRKILSRKEIKKARFAMQKADYILPVSGALKKSIESYGIKNRFQVVPNVVDTNIFYPDGQMKKDETIKKILLVARLSHIKGVSYLLQALHMLKKEREDFFLDIIGDGPNRKEYEILAVELGINDKICFHGIKSKQEIAEFMRKSHFFVLPSLYDNLPCVLIESMASGLPIIATRVGGIPEIINEKVGILIEPSDASQLTNAIDYMLDNLHLYNKGESFKYCKNNFSYEVIGAKFDNIYQEALINKKEFNTKCPHLLRLPKVPIVMGRLNFILDKCNGKRILHLGCIVEGLTEERIKKGIFLHSRLLEVAQEAWGIDISSNGINLLRDIGIRNLIEADVERIEATKEIVGQNFDIILATEVLEHLNNPGLFLQNVKKIFNKDTKMVLTVPNGLRITGFFRHCQRYEFVHPDHNYWFSYSTLKSLLEKNGYEILEVTTYSFFNHLESISKSLLKRILKAFCQMMPLKHNFPEASDASYFTFEWACEVLFRRFLYNKNAFFADGLIFVVKLRNV